MPLSITRRESDSIRLGDDITIKISRISGSTVTLSIDAPPELKVLRGELVGPGKTRTGERSLKGRLLAWL